MLDAGLTVAALDMFAQGEFPRRTTNRAQLRSGDQPWQQYAGFNYGYNRSLLAQRTGDIPPVLSFVAIIPMACGRSPLVNGAGRFALPPAVA